MSTNGMHMGKYRCIRRLGGGGQATTWLALDPETEDEVLVKVFHVELAEDWKLAELFERSATVLESIDHPNIPSYRDHFEFEDGHTIRLCLVRDFVDGDSLQNLIDEGGSFSEAEVVELAIELLEILRYLHQMNPPIVHRDIKPANIILAPEGRPYLVDFGAVQADVLRETGGSTVVGTAGYVAPEQLMGRARPSSDIYALGVTLVHLLTRKAPIDLPSNGFELDYADELVASSQLKYVIGRMTKADSDEREDSAEGLLEKFRTLADGKDIVVRGSTLPVKIPAGSRLEVVETADSVLVRTPRVLTWHSSGWIRLMRLGVLSFYLLTAIFLLSLIAFHVFGAPGFAMAMLVGLSLVGFVLNRIARPLEIELGTDFLRITQPPLRHGLQGAHVDASGWIPYLNTKESHVRYDCIESVDFVGIESGGAQGSFRTMRLSCTPETTLSTFRPKEPGSLFDTRSSSDTTSKSYLLELGITPGEEVWLARLINARLAQHREIRPAHEDEEA